MTIAEAIYIVRELRRGMAAGGATNDPNDSAAGRVYLALGVLIEVADRAEVSE